MKRYDPDDDGKMEEFPEGGDWVKYEDVEILEKKLKQTERKMEKMRKFIVDNIL